MWFRLLIEIEPDEVSQMSRDKIKIQKHDKLGVRRALAIESESDTDGKKTCNFYFNLSGERWHPQIICVENQRFVLDVRFNLYVPEIGE